MEHYLRSYVLYQQEDWAAFLGMAEFAANNHISDTTGASPFLVNHGPHPRMNDATAVPPSAGAPEPLNDFVATMTKAHDHLRAEMLFAQDKHEQHANATRASAPRLALRSRVWLSTKNIKTFRPYKKLYHKRLGPFTIDQVVSSHAYRLVFPASMKSHPGFHVSLLEPASEEPVEGQVMPPPPPMEIEGHEECEVEAVLDSRLRYRRPQYLVKWLGYDAATWQPAHDLLNAPADVERFHRLHPARPWPW